jgi:GNAT superfamily N-acetyltransferase
VSTKTLGPAAIETPELVESLHTRDIPSLPVSWRNRYDREGIADLIASYPGRSVWEPTSGEFVLASPWRHRDEVAILVELAGVRHVRPLIGGLIERCRETGAKLVLTAEMHERQRPEFWNHVGLVPLEDVVSFALAVSADDPPCPLNPRLEFQRVDPSENDQIARLVMIDNSSFPWLWWNNREEFESYLAIDSVEVYLAMAGSLPVGYAGMTRYDQWAHLDRIAVRPDRQGNGFGRGIMHFVTNRVKELGFHRIALSTQRKNRSSRSLYAGMGFQRARDHDYRIYGRWLVDPRTLPGPGEGI